MPERTDRLTPAPAEWSTAACRLAYEQNASIIYVEWNFGRDMAVLAISNSWEALQRAGGIPETELMPAILPVCAKQESCSARGRWRS
ncbi:hypothetical protein ACFCX4_06330 [Kitasatospora sp. NPDC056327]|uniref:hypothetical protein n=1 Tax=Kitasatospora sp. NPDC056327 TaxID=3345785 RepID=UPI0035E1D15E